MAAQVEAMVKLPPRIKVFRTRIGFRDWVVATSSQQRALEAWDVSANLFAAGQAEQTNDPKAIKLALETIGKAVALPMRAKPKAKAAKKSKRGK
ncbi:MAG: hypothetical protein QM759_18290 [Terricaulis sp.]